VRQDQRLRNNMTISKDDLLANKQLALQLIGQYCGGAAIGEEHERSSPHFQPIIDTTWKALADDDCVSITNWYFKITSHGWITAFEATGKLCDAPMKKDLGNLCAALKQRLERTNGTALVATNEIVSDTGLPHYWVVNAIHSHLIRHCSKRKDADWAR
jgi:hypothetical protein